MVVDGDARTVKLHRHGTRLMTRQAKASLVAALTMALRGVSIAADTGQQIGTLQQQWQSWAKGFCENPKSYGFALNGNGSIGARANASKFARALANLDVGAKLGGSASYYQGVRQEDLAKAFADTNTCRQRAYDAFEAGYYRWVRRPTRRATAKPAGTPNIVAKTYDGSSNQVTPVPATDSSTTICEPGANCSQRQSGGQSFGTYVGSPPPTVQIVRPMRLEGKDGAGNYQWDFIFEILSETVQKNFVCGVLKNSVNSIEINGLDGMVSYANLANADTFFVKAQNVSGRYQIIVRSSSEKTEPNVECSLNQ